MATVLLTVDCRGVTCPSPSGDPTLLACVGGRCVSDTCTEEDADTCGAAACAASSDCPAVAACATSECTPSGVCFASPITDACAGGEVCDAARGCRAPGASYVACTDDARCPDGDICVVEFGLSRCRAPCSTDAECAAGQRCTAAIGQVRTHCAGDGCDPVADTGCAAGSTCSALQVAPPSDPGAFSLLPSCRPEGAAAEHASCADTTECAAGACESFGRAAGQCARHCRTSADCDETCAIYRMDYTELGLCTAGCDPIDDAGCGAGLSCFLERPLTTETGGPSYATWCQPAGVRALGEVCSFFDGCAPGGYCLGVGGAPSTCLQVCDVDAPSCDCTPIGATTPGGRRLGLCYPP